MDENVRSPLPGGYLMASRRVAIEGLSVRFMYRERSDNDQDSGWRLFSGDEDQAYAADPDNLGLYSASHSLQSTRPLFPIC